MRHSSSSDGFCTEGRSLRSLRNATFHSVCVAVLGFASPASAWIEAPISISEHAALGHAAFTGKVLASRVVSFEDEERELVVVTFYALALDDVAEPVEVGFPGGTTDVVSVSHDAPVLNVGDRVAIIGTLRAEGTIQPAGWREAIYIEGPDGNLVDAWGREITIPACDLPVASVHYTVPRLSDDGGVLWESRTDGVATWSDLQGLLVECGLPSAEQVLR
jgi:hypothetical protein